jgi:hypothetical protein
MPSEQIVGRLPVTLARLVPACGALRHLRGVVSVDPCTRHRPSCAPFAPGPLRPFLATVGALTPARAVVPVLRLLPAASRSAPSRCRSP